MPVISLSLLRGDAIVPHCSLWSRSLPIKDHAQISHLTVLPCLVTEQYLIGPDWLRHCCGLDIPCMCNASLLKEVCSLKQKSLGNDTVRCVYLDKEYTNPSLFTPTTLLNEISLKQTYSVCFTLVFWIPIFELWTGYATCLAVAPSTFGTCVFPTAQHMQVA